MEIVFDLSQGAVSALRRVFTNFSSRGGWRCLWLELQDYPTVEAVVRDIIRLMALRVGGFHKDHLAVYPIADELTRLFRETLSNQDLSDPNLDKVDKVTASFNSQFGGIRDHFERVVTHYHIAPENWLFFLYGRDTPGGCASWSSAPWQPSDYVLLHAILRVLTSLGFHVVYAPLTETRFKAKQARDKAVRSKRTTDGVPKYVQDQDIHLGFRRIRQELEVCCKQLLP